MVSLTAFGGGDGQARHVPADQLACKFGHGRRQASGSSDVRAGTGLRHAASAVRRLADALDVHFTSIYNHLPSKEAILDGVAERLLQEAQLGTAFSDWQEWVWSFATDIRRLARAHRGAFAVFTRRPAQGPAADAHLEAALGAFRAAGFSPRRANEAVAGIALAVMGMAVNEAPGPGPAPTPGLAHLQPELYPHIAEAARAIPTDTDGMWTLLVGALITGLEADGADEKPGSRLRRR